MPRESIVQTITKRVLLPAGMTVTQMPPQAPDMIRDPAGILARSEAALNLFQQPLHEISREIERHRNAIQLFEAQKAYYDEIAARHVVGAMTEEQMEKTPQYAEAQLLKALAPINWSDLQKSGAEDEQILTRLAGKWPDHAGYGRSGPRAYFYVEKQYVGGRNKPVSARFAIASDNPFAYGGAAEICIYERKDQQLINTIRKLLNIGKPAKKAEVKKKGNDLLDSPRVTSVP